MCIFEQNLDYIVDNIYVYLLTFLYAPLLYVVYSISFTEVTQTEENELTADIEDLKLELRRIEHPHMFKRVEGDGESDHSQDIVFQPRSFPTEGLPAGRTTEINHWLSHHIRVDRLPVDGDQGIYVYICDSAGCSPNYNIFYYFDNAYFHIFQVNINIIFIAHIFIY